MIDRWIDWLIDKIDRIDSLFHVCCIFRLIHLIYGDWHWFISHFERAVDPGFAAHDQRPHRWNQDPELSLPTAFCCLAAKKTLKQLDLLGIVCFYIFYARLCDSCFFYIIMFDCLEDTHGIASNFWGTIFSDKPRYTFNQMGWRGLTCAALPRSLHWSNPCKKCKAQFCARLS